MTQKLSVADLQHVLDTYDKGVLSKGSHTADDGAYCALEAVSLARHKGKKNFTDSPSILGMPDIRPLNDGLWVSDQARTEALLPLIAALSDWSEWSTARRQRWVTQVAFETVKQIISQLPGLPQSIRERCQRVETLDAAYAAGNAAYAAYAAGNAARYAAGNAADAAAYAADAARYAAGNAAYAADAAGNAAYAAYAAGNAAYAAYAAGNAARYAAGNAAYAAQAACYAAYAAQLPLTLAVNIWLQAVIDSEKPE